MTFSASLAKCRGLGGMAASVIREIFFGDNDLI